MVILNNLLAYSAGRGKLGLIDLTNDNQRILNLENYKICTVCDVPTVLMSDEDNIYFSLSPDGIYCYDPQKDSIKFILKPESKSLTTYKNQIYSLFTFYLQERVVDSLRFFRIDPINKESIRIYSKFNRYLRGSKINKFMFISDDTIIAVGKSKLILISYDGGMNFEVASFSPLNFNYNSYFIFDRLNAKITQRGLLWISTTNGGVRGFHLGIGTKLLLTILVFITHFYRVGRGFLKTNIMVWLMDHPYMKFLMKLIILPIQTTVGTRLF